MTRAARASRRSGARWLGEQVASSYLAVPSVMIVIAVGLAFLTTALDGRLELPSFIGSWGAGLDAGLILSTIAGSMITVAALVFSITMVVLTLTAQQYGHRIVRGVMSDRTSQIVFGFFLATFTFCILALALLHRSDAAASIPTVTVAMAILLGIGAVVLLVFFVNHIMVNVRIGSVLASLQKTFETAAAAIYDDDGDASSTERGDRVADKDTSREGSDGTVAELTSAVSGYVQLVRVQRLVTIAEESHIRIRILVWPGDFVHRGQTLAAVSPGPRDRDGVGSAVERAVLIGKERTPAQDLRLGLYQLQEAAIRALSPGINDPHTAMAAIARIRACLLVVAGREEPRSEFSDAEGRLRVSLPVIRFSDLLVSALRPLVGYAARSPDVLSEIVATLTFLESRLTRSADRDAVRNLAVSIWEVAAELCPAVDSARVQKECARLLGRLASP